MRRSSSSRRKISEMRIVRRRQFGRKFLRTDSGGI